MKKVLVLLLTGILFAACGNSGSTQAQQEDKAQEEPVFTEEDIALAKEMIEFVQEKENEFVQKANEELDKTRNSYEEYQTMTNGFTANKEIREDFQDLSNDMILTPLLDNYGQHIIEGERWDLQTRVNVKDYEINGEQVNSIQLEDYEIAMSYENLNLEEPTIEYHEQYGVHELVFPIDDENTVPFITQKETNSTTYEEFTFYKTKDGELLIGKFSPLQYNALVLDFEDDPEDVHEDLQELPPLQ